VVPLFPPQKKYSINSGQSRRLRPFRSQLLLDRRPVNIVYTVVVTYLPCIARAETIGHRRLRVLNVDLVVDLQCASTLIDLLCSSYVVCALTLFIVDCQVHDVLINIRTSSLQSSSLS